MSSTIFVIYIKCGCVYRETGCMKNMCKMNAVFLGIGLIFLSTVGCAKKPKKILFLNSFRQGYAPSDSVSAGIRNTLSTEMELVLDTMVLDLKSQANGISTNRHLRGIIKRIKKSNPDVLLVYGEDAVKYVVAPFFRKGPFPVAFCGIDWACDQYGLPTETVTGMLEEVPIREMIEALRTYYPEMRKLTAISENSISERKNKKYMDALLLQIGMRADYQLVDSFSKWQNAFLRANQDADLVYLPAVGFLEGWNKIQAEEFVFRHIQKPVITDDGSMMRLAVFGMINSFGTEGKWAARTALQILAGHPVRDIPVTVHRDVRKYFNPMLASRIQFRPKPDFLKLVQHIE